MNRNLTTRFYQQGAAALFIAVILLFASSLIVLYAGKIGVQDQRISGNDSRAKQAFANAEAGMEEAASRLMSGGVAYNTTVTYVNSVAEPFYQAQVYKSAGGIEVSSQGYADAYNSDSTATVRQDFGFHNVLGEGPDSPLIVAGNVPPTGNMEIVGNPNGAGKGVNVAVWTSNNVSASGSATTCERGEYEANGSPIASDNDKFNVCSANDCGCSGTIDGIISQSGTVGADIVANDPDFPSDVFAYVFGVPSEKYNLIRGIAEVVGDCSGFDANSNGIYWVEGECDLPGNDIGGATGDNCGKSAERLCTVVIVIDDENLKKTGGDSKLYGLIFMFENPDQTGDAVSTINMGGSTSIYGALIADHSVCASSSCISGSFDLVYERSIFEDLASDETNQILARVAGTWIDQ
ncbi:pilus assembly PilX N-terminal domain-containing protein [Methylomarinum sp. Ch1-1]|uniref:Pilus assembly PilX N-terminal domain-containing protein n=1 Tax=Methylomarinum roseum TaxID=3067653 RepID=A0AAU7NW20_9GAMM|nr:pilus assembly PilX N-terminal domain-containing protein [Methylomarinum sp. Ch1-1]MDP4522744.1 pilus assembly PilX N-terminal domain-containing protein [Methylomarinum sp. Ch1-1]